MRFRLTRAWIVFGSFVLSLAWLTAVVVSIGEKSENTQYSWESGTLKPASLEHKELYKKKTGKEWGDRVRECRARAIQATSEPAKSLPFTAMSEEEVRAFKVAACEVPTPVGTHEEYMYVMRDNPPRVNRSTNFNFDAFRFINLGLLPLVLFCAISAVALMHTPLR